ncbi:unnamed protein product [Brachionus calyciflorus]|uniref:Uncharacterized protein n=1 Tax=Brachionus calyciflorus TaxID=104777 RepID=A0A813ML07_9BILA|nr:unnamed protein product [Brachionus calyciflorus]
MKQSDNKAEGKGFNFHNLIKKLDSQANKIDQKFDKLNEDIKLLKDREDKQNGERNSSCETMLPIGQQNKTQDSFLQTSNFQHQQQQPFFHPYQTTAQPGITVKVQQPLPFYKSYNRQNFSTHKKFRNQYNQVQPQTSYQDLYLPPFSSTVIRVKPNRKFESDVLITSSPFLRDSFSVFVGKGICKFQKDIDINLANLSSKLASLPKGTIVANFEEINTGDFEILTLDSVEEVAKPKDNQKSGNETEGDGSKSELSVGLDLNESALNEESSSPN